MKKRKRPPKATASYGADQARELGLRIGSVIQGRETHPNGEWSEARLRLLWLGKEVAVWAAQYRDSGARHWSEPGDSAAWTLSARDWYLVRP
jgi:hypothetical protein